MCGGPADGRWVTVQNANRDWECMTLAMPKSGDPMGVPIPVRTRYRIYREDVFGTDLWVGVEAHADPFEVRRVIMRTVLQRDVAAHLGAYR